MQEENEFDRALKVALKAHFGQKDRGGKAYILHPLRLAMRVKTDNEKLAALLHDVVEDSDVTLNELRELGFGEEVVEAIDCLTRREGESYQVFIERLSGNKLALRVKIEDLKDNLDLTRLENITEEDFRRIQKYLNALQYLDRRLMGPPIG